MDGLERFQIMCVQMVRGLEQNQLALVTFSFPFYSDTLRMYIILFSCFIWWVFFQIYTLHLCSDLWKWELMVLFILHLWTHLNKWPIYRGKKSYKSTANYFEKIKIFRETFYLFLKKKIARVSIRVYFTYVGLFVLGSSINIAQYNYSYSYNLYVSYNCLEVNVSA